MKTSFIHSLVHSSVSIRGSMPRSKGFTLIELLIILSIFVLNVLVLLPGMAKAKVKDQGITCMNNNKQLLMAWRLYADDHQGVIPHAYGARSGWLGTSVLDYNPDNKSNFDVHQDITKGPLWKYSGESTQIYKCPSDQSVVRINQVAYPRVRSMSMSSWMGGNNGLHSWYGGPEWRMYLKIDDLLDPGPASTWVFMDEREDSINDGHWITSMPGYRNPRTTKFVDYPGSYHDGAASISFADGHTELKVWTDERTTPPLIVGGNIPLNVASPDNDDVTWIQDRTTRLIEGFVEGQ